MNKIFVTTFIAFSMMFAACTSGNVESHTSTQIANPFIETTLAEGIQLAGFSLEIPESIEGYPNQTVFVIKDTLIQVHYSKASSTNNDLMIVKGKGNEDVSGDYNTYKETNTDTINGREVTTKGNDGKIHVVTWMYGEYSYAIDCEDGFTRVQVEQLVNQIN